MSQCEKTLCLAAGWRVSGGKELGSAHPPPHHRKKTRMFFGSTWGEEFFGNFHACFNVQLPLEDQSKACQIL